MKEFQNEKFFTTKILKAKFKRAKDCRITVTVFYVSYENVEPVYGVHYIVS